MTLSPAMRVAERARKNFRSVSDRQHKTLASLSRKAGIELPEVRTKKQASRALTKLDTFLSTPPQLPGFSASTAPSTNPQED